MLKNEIELWKILNKFNISRFTFKIEDEDLFIKNAFEVINGKHIKKPMEIKKGDITYEFIVSLEQFLDLSPIFSQFTVSINRAISFYPEIIDLTKAEDYFKPKNIFLFHSMYILLINALEVYLLELFKGISNQLLISKLDSRLFIKFLKEFNLKDQFLSAFAKNNNLDFALSEILPDRLDFQQREKTKIAYNLIGINVVEIEDELWEKIFSKTDGYIAKRNKIVHSRVEDLIKIENIKDFKLDKEIEEIENAIIDIVQFMFYIETQRLFNYPDPLEIPIIEKFPRKNIQYPIKKKIIELNYNVLIRGAEKYYKIGDINKCKEFLEMLKEVKPDDIYLVNLLNSIKKE